MDKYLEVLKRYWGYDSFRGVQRDIIESVGAGHDTLGLMPTGGGKSITFQVPTMARDGLCLVITPLIALMKDQVTNLRRLNIKATAINMGMSHDDVIAALENCIFGHYKFLYVSPERLSSPLFLKKLSRIPVSLITIDEAHCISQWGYDFRPSYLEIGHLRNLLPGIPVLALTATATPRVVEDIQQQLHFTAPNVFRMSFDRPNIKYVVRNVDGVEDEMLHILRNTMGSSIVYCRNREAVGQLADLINSIGIKATSYHAGLSYELRDKRQREWTHGDKRVMVATNAFGMGIDKADVRLVIHVGLPDCLESYYQEAGRAGRDGQASYAVLLFSTKHVSGLHRRIITTFPPREMIATVYEHLCYFFQLAVDDGMGVSRMLDLQKFCVTFRHYPSTVVNSLRILSHAGYLAFEEDPDRASRLCFTVRREDLYKLSGFDSHGDDIINVILRYYGGVFSDQKFIDESFIADMCGVEQDYVYLFLKTLDARHIVQYIPVRQLPVVTFMRRRVDTSRLHIPKNVYEERRDAYAARVNQMIDYAKDNSKCRGNVLMEYFGETVHEHCNHCDVCMADNREKRIVGEMESVMSRIRTLFSEGNHDLLLSELRDWPYDSDSIRRAVQRMVDNDEAYVQGMTLTKC